MATAGRGVDTVDAKFSYEDLKKEKNRLATFDDKSWRDTGIDKHYYATAGFFYTGQGDVIKCPYCHVEVKNMKTMKGGTGKKLSVLHAAISGNCSFTTERLVNKNPSLHCDASPSHSEQELVQSSEEEPTSTFETKSKHKSMNNYNDRLKTFKDFPIVDMPKGLAEAGFFHDHNPKTTAADKVICHWCDGSLEGWNSREIPWEEHAKYYPACSYLRKTKGTDYILGERFHMNDAERNKAKNLKYSGGFTILNDGYAEYNNVIKRSESFENCNNKQEFAGMGFHEVYGQYMMCYSCGLILDKTLKVSDVQRNHWNQSENCDMVNGGPAIASEDIDGSVSMAGFNFIYVINN